jgi:P2 family phage contractile tail tube protein
MALTYVMRKFIVYADGVGKFGEGEDCKLPAMEIHTEDFRGGGMDSAVKFDMGMNPLTLEFKLSAFDPQVYKLWGLYPGQDKQFTLRGSLASFDGSPYAAIASCLGNLRKADADNFTPGKKILHTFTCDLSYYKLTLGEQLIYDIDIINGTRFVAGADQNQQDLIALGLR